jgi:hypothetical protein
LWLRGSLSCAFIEYALTLIKLARLKLINNFFIFIPLE